MEVVVTDDPVDHRKVTLQELQDYIGEWARRKKWDFNLDDTPEKIALMHSELSEMLEEYRKGGLAHTVYYTDTPQGKKPEGIPIELADLLIRVLHYFANFGVSASEMVMLKMEYNEKRPERHGKVC